MNNSNRDDNCDHCQKSSELIQDTNINNDETDDFNEIQSSLPAVIETLREHGQLDLYKKWCHLLAKKQFPMENICYLLFLDIVEWFSKPCTSQMRYINENTLNFWCVGYRLFHRKFIRFMNDPKSTGQVLTGQTEHGHCLARKSEINFAVPSVSVFNKDPLQPMLPGFFLKSINKKDQSRLE